MEKVRQKQKQKQKQKSEVLTITEGNMQIHRQTRKSKLASDSGSYSSGTAEEDLFTGELGRSSFRRVTGTPIKKLLAEEMSKEPESKRRSPSVIASLMGLDGLPPQQPLVRQHKECSETYQPRTAWIASQRDYEHRSSRKNSMEQDKFKDVYEVSEIPKVERGSYPAKRTVNSKLSEAETALFRQEFMVAKHFSTAEKLHNSEEVCDTFGMLDTNKDLLMKFLRQPDSLFAKHLIDLQVDAPSTQCSRIAVIKPSNAHKYESNTIGWKSEKETLRCDTTSYRKHADVPHRKHHDGLSIHSYSHCGAQKPLKSLRIQLDGKNERDILPIRIVVLKPNLEKVQNATKSVSSPCSSHGNLSDCRKNMEYQSIGAGEARSRVKKDLSENVAVLRPKSRESRERAKEVTRRMRESFHGELIDLSSKVKGYAGDESSYDVSGSDSGSESEETLQISRKSFHWSNRQKPSSSHAMESSLSREAKKRLSERWKMSRRYQDIGSIGKSSTLGEMLAIPDRKVRSESLDPLIGLDGSSDRFASNDGIAEWDSPLGISSGDGWKEECVRNSSRSRSVPALSVRCRGPKTSMQCETLDQESYLMSGDARNESRNKTIAGNFNTKKVSSSRNLRSGSKSQFSHHNSSDSTNSLEEKQFNQSQIEINLGKKDPSEQKPLVTEMPANIVTDASSIADVESDDGHKDMTMPSESPDELPPNPSACLKEYNNSASPGPEDLKAQEPEIGPSDDDSVQQQCPLPEPQSPASSKEADHPSPVSVLDAPFTEDISSGSECFERVSADLQELRMQLKLLKMESGSCADGGTLMSSDKGISQGFIAVSEENGASTDENWESSYLVDVLISSGFDDSDLDMFISSWHSPECPLGPSLFENLEPKYRDNTCSRSDRRLLFDRLNSGLVEMFGRFTDPHPWVKPVATRKVGHARRKRGVKHELREVLASEENRANEYVSETVLDREMQWLDSGDGTDAIGTEIEKLLIDDLIAEVANM